MNGQMIWAATLNRGADWININDYMKPGQDNVLAFANYKGGGYDGGSWAFSIRRDDVAVWGIEQASGNRNALNYVQQVVIRPDGQVEPKTPDASTHKPPKGKWYVRVQKTDDIGSVLVNGQPVAMMWNDFADWVDITSQLYSDRDNTITFAAWNFEGPYSYDFAVANGDTIVWGKQSSGSGLVNRFIQEDVTITAKGELTQSIATNKAADYTWSVRAYNTKDASVIFMNGQMIWAANQNRGSEWININDYMKPDQDNVVAFANYKGGGYDGASWAFSVRRDDIAVWGIEQGGGNRNTLNYVQQVVIHSNGQVERKAIDTTAHKAPSGNWYIRVQKTDDIGSVLVNGQPVAVMWNDNANWVDITGQLYSDRDNIITFSAWNFDANYSWDFAIKHDEDIKWAINNTGSGQTGVVLQQNVVITGDGKVQQP